MKQMYSKFRVRDIQYELEYGYPVALPRLVILVIALYTGTGYPVPGYTGYTNRVHYSYYTYRVLPVARGRGGLEAVREKEKEEEGRCPGTPG